MLAYLARRRANCALVAARCPEFADDAKVQERQCSILIDEIAGGLHEGEAIIAAERASAAREDYPFVEHRPLAQFDAGEGTLAVFPRIPGQVRRWPPIESTW